MTGYAFRRKREKEKGTEKKENLGRWSHKMHLETQK
jgi:hypothetical protein